jgi:hypothetical protein
MTSTAIALCTSAGSVTWNWLATYATTIVPAPIAVAVLRVGVRFIGDP